MTRLIKDQRFFDPGRFLFLFVSPAKREEFSSFWEVNPSKPNFVHFGGWWSYVKSVKSIHLCKREKRRMNGVIQGGMLFFGNFILLFDHIDSNTVASCLSWRLLMEMNEGPIGIQQKALMPGFWKSQTSRENWHTLGSSIGWLFLAFPHIFNDIH